MRVRTSIKLSALSIAAVGSLVAATPASAAVSPHGLVVNSKSFPWLGGTCTMSISMNTSGSNVVSYSSLYCDKTTPAINVYNFLGKNQPLDKQSSKDCLNTTHCGAPDLSEANPSGSQKFCAMNENLTLPNGTTKFISVCTSY